MFYYSWRIKKECLKKLSKWLHQIISYVTHVVFYLLEIIFRWCGKWACLEGVVICFILWAYLKRVSRKTRQVAVLNSCLEHVFSCSPFEKKTSYKVCLGSMIMGLVDGTAGAWSTIYEQINLRDLYYFLASKPV